MRHALSLLLVIGSLASLATAQRPECPRGNAGAPQCRYQVEVGRTEQPAPPTVRARQRDASCDQQSTRRVRGEGSQAQNRRKVGAGRQGTKGGNGSKARNRGRAGNRRSNTGNGNGQGRRGQCNGGTCLMAAPGSSSVTTPLLPPDQARIWIARLQPVLESELYAKEYYEAAYNALGVRRHQNLANAEQNHAEAIAYAIELCGGTPQWVQNETITPPTTVDEADAHCEEIELYVIDVYNGLIADAPAPELSVIFRNIQRANYKHLDAVDG